MASQETANTAAESATDRKENMVKSNATLPPGFRARPQGPPGSPRNPLNNGPIGQPRPGGQPPPQIRFDNRAPLRPSSPGQIIQLRPYGQPRPPGNSLPQKPPQQAQNPPIVLNPRFAPSSINNKTGPQQRPRLPQPGNFQGQQLPRNAQQPLQPGFEHPPTQTRNPDVLARSQEIAQRQLQRNESLLSFPPNTLTQKEERKPPIPRIVVERMADVDNARKLQQIENSVPKEKVHENTENDDDDDVVVDGKKSPRPDSSKESLESRTGNKETAAQSPRRPETATINGKMNLKPKVETAEELSDTTETKVTDKVTEKLIDQVDSKPKDKVTEGINDKVDAKIKDKTAEESNDKHINDIAANTKPDVLENGTCKMESAKDSTGMKNDLPSTNLELRTESFDKREKTENKGEKKESENKTVENLNVAEKANTNKELRPEDEKRIASPMPEVKANEASKSVAESSNEEKQKEQELNTNSPDKSRACMPTEANQNQKEQLPKTPSKSPDKSPANVSSEPTEKQKDELKAPPKSAESSRSTTPVENNQAGHLKTPSKSPDKSRASTPADINGSGNEEESKELNKTPDKSRASTPAETNKAKETSESKSSESKPTETSDDKKVEEPKATNEPVDKKGEDALAKEKSKQEEEPKAPIQVSEKSEENFNEKQPKDSVIDSSEVSSKATEESEKETKEVAQPAQGSLEPKTISPSASSSPVKESSPSASSASVKETRVSPTLSEGQEKLLATESILSPSKSPEDGVKGFDNGQRRSLSPKSPVLSSPQSPLSRKSPTNSEKSIGHEKKKATFVESSDEKELTDEKKVQSKPSTPKIQRAPTPAHVDEKSEKKIVTATTGIENGNAMEDSSQSNAIPATNGVEDSPTKKSPSKTKDADKRSTAGSPVKSPNKSIKSLPRTPETPSSTAGQEKKKVPMNKIQVGAAPSPNLKTVRSKIGSLENTSYKPGGGNVKIENRKLDFSKAQPKIAAKNEKYTPSGGDKKIAQVKLQWNAKPKVGSLENATHKPGGGDKKIETVKLDFKDKAKSKVGSKENAKHVPGGGNIKSSSTPPKTPQDSNNDIQTQKIDVKAESKIGSLDNVKHKPGGGDKKIFNDRDYLRQSGSNVESLCASGSQIENVEEFNSSSTELSKEILPQPPPTTPTKTRKLSSPSSMVTPKAIRNSFTKSSETIESKKNSNAAKTVTESKKNLNSEDGKTVTENRTAKSPTSTEYNLKSPDKSSPRIPRKTSPKNIRFPKLAPSPVPPETAPISETHTKISLPKLTEHSTQFTSVTH